MLDGGHFTSAAGIWREGESMEERVRYPVPAYLIETGEERILVDTGLHPGAVADPEAHYGAGALALFALELEAGIDRQLDLGTVTRVVLTHLHFDHAGGSSLFCPRRFRSRSSAASGRRGSDPEAIARNFFLPARLRGPCRPGGAGRRRP